VANGLTLRKNAANLNATELAALRDAYRRMQQITDNRGYAYWAGIHGYPQWFCWHHGRVRSGTNPRPVELFLPWHRAYLLLFEHAARDQVSTAAVPWWDWTSLQSRTSGVPAAFSTPTASGQPNPLYRAQIPAPFSRATRRFPGSPSQLPTPTVITGLLALTSFVDFSRQLEDVHDAIHGWTGGVGRVGGRIAGGDMGTLVTAAYDPIFWSHHCMIDRIWYLWQLRNGVNNIPQDYLDLALAPFPLRVRDVLNINSLGYEYSSTGVRVPVSIPA